MPGKKKMSWQFFVFIQTVTEFSVNSKMKDSVYITITTFVFIRTGRMTTALLAQG